jgi:hypothetical protein
MKLAKKSKIGAETVTSSYVRSRMMPSVGAFLRLEKQREYGVAYHTQVCTTLYLSRTCYILFYDEIT